MKEQLIEVGTHTSTIEFSHLSALTTVPRKKGEGVVKKVKSTFAL